MRRLVLLLLALVLVGSLGYAVFRGRFSGNPNAYNIWETGEQVGETSLFAFCNVSEDPERPVTLIVQAMFDTNKDGQPDRFGYFVADDFKTPAINPTPDDRPIALVSHGLLDGADGGDFKVDYDRDGIIDATGKLGDLVVGEGPCDVLKTAIERAKK